MKAEKNDDKITLGKSLKETSISRRGLFAALACASGLTGLGASAVTYSSITSSAEEFNTDRIYRIRTALTSESEPMCIDVYGGHEQDGTNIHLYRANETTSQMFFIHRTTAGYVIESLIFVGAGGEEGSIPRTWKCLDVTGGVAANGTNVELYTPNGRATQRWDLVGHSDGTFEIVSRLNSNFCLDANGGVAADGTNIQIFGRIGSLAQRWYIEAIDMGWEPFSADTESTRFSALVTNEDLEDGEVSFSFTNAIMGNRWISEDYDRSAKRDQHCRTFSVNEQSVVTAIYPQVGTYYGKAVGVRVTYSDIELVPLGDNDENIGDRRELRIPESFSAKDPSGLWIVNVWAVTQSCEFFYCDDSSRRTIEIDHCYWSESSLSYNRRCGWYDFWKTELCMPLSDGGWTGKSYVLPDYFERAGYPTVVRTKRSNRRGTKTYTGYMGLGTTDTKDNKWILDYIGVTCAYSGKTLKMRLGEICFIPYDDACCIATRFESLWKTSELPIHFCVVDPAKEASDPSYSPSEVYQCSFQQGDMLKRNDGIFDDATKALMAAYGSCVTPEDYWYAEREFKGLFTSAVIKSETYIWARISTASVIYHVDGIGDESIAYTDANVPAGAYAVPDMATQAALAVTCNLNDHFNEDPSTGFTGWFTDKGLTAPYCGSELAAGDELHLYGRNRCTVRVDYAEGSLRPQEGMIFRDGATDSAAEVADALGLIDFSSSVETHIIDGITLPAICDDGLGHKAVYWGERVAPAKPAGVYAKQPDGTWRRYVAECWLTTAGGFLDRINQGETGHHALYQVVRGSVGRRHEFKEINIIRDGGAPSVPRTRMSLAGGVRR